MPSGVVADLTTRPSMLVSLGRPQRDNKHRLLPQTDAQRMVELSRRCAGTTHAVGVVRAAATRFEARSTHRLRTVGSGLSLSQSQPPLTRYADDMKLLVRTFEVRMQGCACEFKELCRRYAAPFLAVAVPPIMFHALVVTMCTSPFLGCCRYDDTLTDTNAVISVLVTQLASHLGSDTPPRDTRPPNPKRARSDQVVSTPQGAALSSWMRHMASPRGPADEDVPSCGGSDGGTTTAASSSHTAPAACVGRGATCGVLTEKLKLWRLFYLSVAACVKSELVS